MISIQTVGLDNVLKLLDPKLVRRAHVRATNRSITKGRTEWSRGVRKDYAVKAGDISKASRLRRLSNQGRFAGLELIGEVASLKYFAPRPTARGVSVKVRKAGARKVIGGAFIARGSGNEHVYRRTGERRVMTKGSYQGQVREVIDKLLTVSIPQMADDPGVIDATLAAIRLEYANEFGRQINLLGEAL